MLIKIRQLKDHKQFFNLHCVKRWAYEHNIDWHKFLREGCTTEELLAAAPNDNLLKEAIVRWNNDQLTSNS